MLNSLLPYGIIRDKNDTWCIHGARATLCAKLAHVQFGQVPAHDQVQNSFVCDAVAKSVGYIYQLPSFL